jgi:hypothetical protein
MAYSGSVRYPKTLRGGEWAMVRTLVPLLVSFAVVVGGGAGCVTGKVLHLPGDLHRPGIAAVEPPPGSPVVAVLDFSYAGTPPYEIGRDYDHARSIVWNRNPGISLADLLADVLAENGFHPVRVPDDSAVPADAVAKVWGRVEELRVTARKSGTLRLTVDTAASVSATLFASGGTSPPGWSSGIASDYVFTEPFSVTPGSVRKALNGAANAVAEEAVRRLRAAGALPPPRPPFRGPEGGGAR